MDHTAKIIAILRPHMREDGVCATGGGRLADLGIDRIDLPLIALDLEDAFDIDISHDDLDQFETAHCIAMRVQALLERRHQRRPVSRTSSTHSSSAWLRASLKP